jgi:hypothetical protein
MEYTGHIILKETNMWSLIWALLVKLQNLITKKCIYVHVKTVVYFKLWYQVSLWSCSYDSWIYNYLCNQCLSPLTLWIRIPLMARCTRYNIMWQSLSVTCGRSVFFFTDTLVSSTNKTDRQSWYNWNLLKVVLNTIIHIPNPKFYCRYK